MEIQTETKVISVTLTMTQEEAEWLKDVMQNPFCEDCGREDEETKHMRGKFFSTLATVWPQQKEPPAPIKQAKQIKCPNCGESEQKKIVHVASLRNDPPEIGESVFHNYYYGRSEYDHRIECASCKYSTVTIRTKSTTMPEVLAKAWMTE